MAIQISHSSQYIMNIMTRSKEVLLVSSRDKKNGVFSLSQFISLEQKPHADFTYLRFHSSSEEFFIFICVIILILIAPSCANEAFSEIALNIQVASE